MSLRSELESLRDANGNLHPPVVVEWASRNPGSEIYAALEWDDTKAGHLYRVEQVRRLIQVVLISPATGYRETFSLVSDRKAGNGYRDTDDVVTIPQMKDEAIQMAIRDLELWARRYWFLRDVDKLHRVFRDIDRLGRGGGPSSGPSPPPATPPGGGGPGRGGPGGGGGRSRRVPLEAGS